MSKHQKWGVKMKICPICKKTYDSHSEEEKDDCSILVAEKYPNRQDFQKLAKMIRSKRIMKQLAKDGKFEEASLIMQKLAKELKMKGIPDIFDFKEEDEELR